MSITYHCFFFYFLYIMLFSFLIPCFSTINDCLQDYARISDANNSILVSSSEVFELGFFIPDKTINKNRHLGIWYYNSNPKIVVWVANRENPLKEPNSYLAVNNGVAELLGADTSVYWRTDSSVAAKNNPTKLCLVDDGNLILLSDQGKSVLWQSFDHPTDTVLPGMMMFNGRLSMKSWKNHGDPALGTSTLVLQSGKDAKLSIMKEGYPKYWDSGVDHSSKIPSVLSKFLLDGNSNGGCMDTSSRYPSPCNLDGGSSLPNDTRLVINVTGQVQLWKRKSEGSWSLEWFEPKDRCSFDTVCGSFGSCNSNHGLPCKCLPGFRPSLRPEWDSGCYSGGCVAEFGSPSERKNNFDDEFVRLPMMKIGDEGDETCDSESTEEECSGRCLKDWTCVAYSYGVGGCKGNGNATKKVCSTWSHELTRLQEEVPGGRTLFVRTPSSAIKSTPRTCEPCGAYTIPYPLSTGANCGDSSYFNLHCNSNTRQLNFSTTNTFKVTLIDPNTTKLSIQIMHTNTCDIGYINSFVLPPKKSSPFYVKNCTIIENNPLIQLEQPFIEVDIGWLPPQEPTCGASLDCVAWPHTTCKGAKGGSKRCICGANYHWDGLKLTCIKEGPLRLKIVFPCIAAALVAILVIIIIFFIHRTHRKKVTEKKRSIKFQDEDTEEGVDVPIFSWGSILSATNNFADGNKLGTGGFGSVYKGKLPDGKEIAVKRLSKVSNQGIAEFKTEVVLIARLQHRNLVRLLGYCVKSDENILVYEYMPNGSLDSSLFDNTFSGYLNWEKRFDIIFGIARGLVYLHQDSRLRVIHRDLKPSNILLDVDLNPKISDFGIARIVGGKETEASTNKVVGTYGYMAPEYACEGFFSIKSDVFSFGVVILETISGLRNSRTTVFEHGLSLLGHAWRLWTKDKGLDFIDPSIKDSCNTTEALKCIHVGLLCIQDDPIDRPTMPTVVLMLSNEATVSQSLPKKPTYFTRTTSSETVSSSSLGGSSFFSNMITISSVGR